MKLKSILAMGALLAAPSLMAQAAPSSQARPQTPATTPAPARTPAPGPAQPAPSTSQTPATGAAAPAQQPVDPAKAAAVRELMDVTGSGKLGEEIVDLLTSQVQRAVASAIPQQDRMQQFMAAFNKNFGARVTAAQINEAVIPVYAEHLSLDDLNALVAFYKTPAGQNVIKALPLIIQEAQTTGSNMAQPAAIETLRQMATDYPELNQILARQQSAAPSTAPPSTGVSPNQPAPTTQPSLRQIPSQ